MLNGFHHVLLVQPSGGEDASRAFYGDLLGMTELPKPAELAARGGCWFRTGAVELHLGVEDPCRPSPKAHVALLVEDLDALVARLRARGVIAEPDDLLPGFRRAYVRDPHGNRLELLEPAGVSAR